MIASPPVIPFFILFVTLGGWLLVVLTLWYWEWSGMASLGVLYLILIAPLITGIMAWNLRFQRALSVFHSCAFFISGAYTCFTLAGVTLAFGLHLIGR